MQEIQVDEITETCELHYFAPDYETPMFIIRPVIEATKLRRCEVFQISGDAVILVRVLPDHLTSIKFMARFIANNPMNLHLDMHVIHK